MSQRSANLLCQVSAALRLWLTGPKTWAETRQPVIAFDSKVAQWAPFISNQQENHKAYQMHRNLPLKKKCCCHVRLHPAKYVSSALKLSKVSKSSASPRLFCRFNLSLSSQINATRLNKPRIGEETFNITSNWQQLLVLSRKLKAIKPWMNARRMPGCLLSLLAKSEKNMHFFDKAALPH